MSNPNIDDDFREPPHGKNKSTVDPPTSDSTVDPPTSDSTVDPPTSDSTVDPSTSDSTVNPPTDDSTQLPLMRAIYYRDGSIGFRDMIPILKNPDKNLVSTAAVKLGHQMELVGEVIKILEETLLLITLRS